MALNLCLPAFGASRDRAAPWRCRAVGEQAAGWFWGCGCSKNHEWWQCAHHGSEASSPRCACVLWGCVPGAWAGRRQCQGGSQAQAAWDAGTAQGITGEERGPGWAESDCGAAAGGSKTAQGLCRGCWGCPWAKGSLQSRGGGIYPTGILWGLISPGHLGLGFFLEWRGVVGCPWSILLDCKFVGVLRVLLGESKKCSGT